MRGKTYQTRITGVTFGDRQYALTRVKVGESVFLVREPGNEHDGNAIRVERHVGVQLGYIPRELARSLAPKIDQLGGIVEATVNQLTGPFPNRGAVLTVGPLELRAPRRAHDGSTLSILGRICLGNTGRADYRSLEAFAFSGDDGRFLALFRNAARDGDDLETWRCRPLERLGGASLPTRGG